MEKGRSMTIRITRDKLKNECADILSRNGVGSGMLNQRSTVGVDEGTRLKNDDLIFDKTDYQEWSNEQTSKCQSQTNASTVRQSRQEHESPDKPMKAVESGVYEFGICPVHGRFSLENTEIAEKEGCPNCGHRLHRQTFIVFDD